MEHSQRFLDLVNGAKKVITECTPEDLNEKLDAQQPFVLIDCRESSEWAQGSIPKAKHLCKGIIERDIENMCPDLGADIVVYCGGGYRSALAVQNLQKMGYHNIVSLADGFRGWKEKAFPITIPSTDV